MSNRFLLTLGIPIVRWRLAGALASVDLARGGSASALGFDTDDLEKTVNLCDDFSRFAMGGWMTFPIHPRSIQAGKFDPAGGKNQQI